MKFRSCRRERERERHILVNFVARERYFGQLCRLEREREREDKCVGSTLHFGLMLFLSLIRRTPPSSLKNNDIKEAERERERERQQY